MSYATIPPVLPDVKEHLRKISMAINSILQGKMNATSTVTLRENEATTVLTDSRLSVSSFIGLMPTTANAATELATLYITDQNTGTATINHANNAQTDRTFTVLIIG